MTFNIFGRKDSDTVSADFNAHFLFQHEVKIGYFDFTNSALTYASIEKDITEKWYKSLRKTGFKPTMH